MLQKTGEIDWSTYWEPQLYIDNVVGEPRETVWHTVMFDPEMHAFVFEKRRIAGTFVENLELYQFPFDTQVWGPLYIVYFAINAAHDAHS